MTTSTTASPGFQPRTGRIGSSTRGQRKFPANLLDAGPFSEGLATTREGNKTGYIDMAGKLVIPRQFDAAEPFSEGLAVIGKAKRYGYIDQRGASVIEPKYAYASPFSDGVARVVEQGPCELPPSGLCGGAPPSPKNLPRCQYSFIDKQGNRLFDATYSDAGQFAEGLAPVSDGSKWGYVDKEGRVRIAFQFEKAQPFSEGLASVEIAGGKTGFIDHSGKFVIPPSLPYAASFSEGFAVVWDRSRDRYWYLDRTGKQTIPGEFVAASDFVMGRAPVRELIHYDRMTGEYIWRESYIDSTGRKVYSLRQRVK